MLFPAVIRFIDVIATQRGRELAVRRISPPRRSSELNLIKRYLGSHVWSFAAYWYSRIKVRVSAYSFWSQVLIRRDDIKFGVDSRRCLRACRTKERIRLDWLACVLDLILVTRLIAACFSEPITQGWACSTTCHWNGPSNHFCRNTWLFFNFRNFVFLDIIAFRWKSRCLKLLNKRGPGNLEKLGRPHSVKFSLPALGAWVGHCGLICSWHRASFIPTSILTELLVNLFY